MTPEYLPVIYFVYEYDINARCFDSEYNSISYLSYYSYPTRTYFINGAMAMC